MDSEYDSNPNQKLGRCEPPAIFPKDYTLYKDGQLNIVNYNDNDQPNGEGLVHPSSEKSFIRYTIDTDTNPNYFNGIVQTGNVKINLEDVPPTQNKEHKIAAVACRLGYADSEVVIKKFKIGILNKKKELDVIFRNQGQEEVPKSDLNRRWNMESERKEHPSSSDVIGSDAPPSSGAPSSDP